MTEASKVFVAGHRGLVGGAIVRHLRNHGHQKVVTRTRAKLDLRRQAETEAFFNAEKPDAVVLAAGKVGGIHANDTYPAEFSYDNLAIQTNVIEAAYRNGVSRFIFLGSSCIYPRECPQPIREEYLLSSPLEPTNDAYAIAKIAGLKQCASYRRQYGWDAVSLMPTNLYGPGDNFHPEHSHVIPGMLQRFHAAKLAGAERVGIWGSGQPRREFLYVDDLATAVAHVLQAPELPHDIYNVGTGTDLPIADLAALLLKVIGHEVPIDLDPSKPDGTPRKLLDIGRIKALGWAPQVDLEEGLARTYAWFLEHEDELRAK
ncbi:MAG: GDP-L-fucose synthase [Planctomycetota bacterium]|nr:GDP-L-fucose synthase [Planctomycetota bacterium]